MSTKSTKGVRKLERPRPLRLNSDPDKSSSTVLSPAESVTMLIDASPPCGITDEDVLKDIELLHISVNNGIYDATILSLIANVCDLLKLKGASMESTFKDQLDCYFVTLRNASREERLDAAGRLRLLEVIELRAMGWNCNENLTDYYKRKLAELEGHEFSTYNSSSTQMGFLPQLHVQPQPQQHTMAPIAPATSPPLSLQPTEVLKSSGKFGKPAKIPGRNFLKDEIVIRNSDSGKVMGIKGRRVHMIEELSDTVISFQRGDVLHGVAVCPLTHSLSPHQRLSSSHCKNAAQACTLVLLIPLACHAVLLMKPLACYTAVSWPCLVSRQLVD